MKSRSMLSGITATLLATGAPAVADSPAASLTVARAEQAVQQARSVEEQAAQYEAVAHEMMAHINLAQLALDLGLADEAADQVQDARNLEMALAAVMPQVMLRSTFKYGKVSHSGTSTGAGRYIRLVNHVFLVGGHKALFKVTNATDIDETSAGIRHAGDSVDLREVDAALAKAAGALTDDKPIDASAALDDVFNSAIYSELQVDDPKSAILDSLALARSFVDHGRYDSARVTLEYAADRVARAKEGELPSIDDESLNRFTSDVNAIRRQLRKKDPTLGERIADLLSNWCATVYSWFG